VGELLFGGAVFQPRIPSVKLPVPSGLSLSLGEYEAWMTQTGEGPDADEKMRLFLAMLKGSQRPIKSASNQPWRPEDGSFDLSRYTCKGSSSYNVIFDTAIRAKFPGWFKDGADSVEKKIQVILEMPSGSPRPHRKTPLGMVVSRYTCKSFRYYNRTVDDTIRARHPSWFNASDEMKRQILAMPLNSRRPKLNTPEGHALANYTAKSSSAYDTEFDGAVRIRYPKWFLTYVAEIKKKLLSMPKCSPKPLAETPEGRILFRYACKSGTKRDPEFSRVIHINQPQWFISASDRIKESLLRMPPRSPKPKPGTPEYQGLYNYTYKRSSAYHPEFDATIRAMQPQWFLAR
jgi:hypothetical protein